MNLFRKDCFASRLGEAQREELFAALSGDMTLSQAVTWVHEHSEPKRKQPPSEGSVCKWFAQERRARAMREWAATAGGSRGSEFRVPGSESGSRGSESAGRGSESQGRSSEFRVQSSEAGKAGARSATEMAAQRDADEEMGEQVRRGLLKAKHFCVMEGLEAREVAAFERNEIWRQRLELDERKHEYAMQVGDSAKKLEAMEEQLDAMQEDLDEVVKEARTDRTKRKQEFDSQVGINMMLIELHRMKTGEQFWLPDKGPDGRYHQAVPGQPEVPVETVERAVAITRAADLIEVRRAATEVEKRMDAEAAAAAAAEKAEGLKGGKAEAAAGATETPNAKIQTPKKDEQNSKPDAVLEGPKDQGTKGPKDEGVNAPGAAGSRVSDAEIEAFYERMRAKDAAKSAADSARSDAQRAESERQWRVAKGLPPKSEAPNAKIQTPNKDGQIPKPDEGPKDQGTKGPKDTGVNADRGTRKAEVAKPEAPKVEPGTGKVEVAKPEVPKVDRWGGAKPPGQYW